MTEPAAKPIPDSKPIPDAIARLAKLAGGPRDNALLHHAIGTEWAKLGEHRRAAESFRAALERDERFSAAWKLLGKSLLEAGDIAGARVAWSRGVSVAEQRGDLQAVKEMQVFLRRLPD